MMANAELDCLTKPALWRTAGCQKHPYPNTFADQTSGGFLVAFSQVSRRRAPSISKTHSPRACPLSPSVIFHDRAEKWPRRDTSRKLSLILGSTMIRSAEFADLLCGRSLPV